ncbi:MAG: DUF4157 domain-containing protein [Sulfuricella sp.]|jgi:hypothetical protein
MADEHCTKIRISAVAGALIGFAQRPRVRGALRGAQARLAVSQPHDPLEREADRVADEVVHGVAGANIHPAGAEVQRTCKECEDELREKKIQARPIAGNMPAVADELTEGMASLQGRGVPLPPSARGFFEPRFGRDFSAVSIHSGEPAARLARSVGARAFTLGRDIVFGAGEYAPSSTAGQHLLAHELTHVVQQSSGSAPSTLQRDALPAQPDERVTACLSQTDDILPGRVGLLMHLDRSIQLLDALGPEYQPLERQIRQSPEARRFVCEAGVPGVVALWDTRSAQGALDVAAARQALRSQPGRYDSFVMPRRRQERRLAEAGQGARAVGEWAGDTTRSQNLASSILIPTLPAPQRGNLQQSVTRLQEALPHMETAATRSSGLSGNLNALDNHLSAARREINGEYGVMRARIALRQADTEMGTIMTGLRDTQARANIDALANEGDRVQRDLTALIALGEGISQEAIDTVREQARRLRTHVRDSARELGLWPGSARKVMFLLRYLIAFSSQGFANAPGAADIGLHRAQLDLIGEDLERLFGSGPMDRGLEFIAAAARRIKAQLDVRGGMDQALGRATALVPSQTDTQAYFTSLREQPNAAVRQTYERFAGAFFEHGVVTRMGDLAVANIDDIFARPPGAVGVRSLVCSGYALLGARLLELAGGRVERFIIGVRASDQQLRAGNTLDDAHALAQIRRKGERFFVSNDSVVNREQDGIGPNAVAWTRPDNPIYTGRGNTLAAAVRSAQQRLSQRIRQLGP